MVLIPRSRGRSKVRLQHQNSATKTRRGSTSSRLRRLVESMSPTGSRSQAAVAASASATKIPLKYRVKKSFDQIDRDDFRSTAYETFRDFFEKSVKELDGIDDLRARYQSIGPPHSPAPSSMGRSNAAAAARRTSPFTLHPRQYSARSTTPSRRTHRPTPQTAALALTSTIITRFCGQTTSRTTTAVGLCPRRRPPAGCGKASSKQADSSQDTQRFLRTADSFTRSRGTIASAHAACSRRNPRSALGSFPRLRS